MSARLSIVAGLVLGMAAGGLLLGGLVALAPEAPVPSGATPSAALPTSAPSLPPSIAPSVAPAPTPAVSTAPSSPPPEASIHVDRAAPLLVSPGSAAVGSTSRTAAVTAIASGASVATTWPRG